MNSRYKDLKTRGFAHKHAGRFQRYAVQPEQTAPDSAEFEVSETPSQFYTENAKSIVSHNQSPDIPFNASINSYRGCEHGCVYCYARPSHSYLDLSPALDFETQIFCKDNGTALLRKYLQRPGYRCEPITLGANTDPYQPIEKTRGLSRQLLELFVEYRHPCSIITKGTLIERDADLLEQLAEQQLCRVAISLPTLDPVLKRSLEPRVPSARARLRTIKALAARGIPITVLVAPVIPRLTDPELESILENAANAGANAARYIMLRLPHELKQLFTQWLHTHKPMEAEAVLSYLRSLNGGTLYQSAFGRRQSGQGPLADIIKQRFEAACRRNGLSYSGAKPLRTTLFAPPGRQGPQTSFDF
ncbi:MAG: PA0069 family radical SAM protein [Pseudomonadota bacterium]